MDNEKLDIIQSDSGIAADVRAMIEQTREGVAQTVNIGGSANAFRRKCSATNVPNTGKKFCRHCLQN